jgi:DNA-binding response OmpR family regulator
MTNVTEFGTKIKKALVVEDNSDMCLLLDIMLNGKDVELDHVKNLSAAQEYLQKEQPSVIILDNKLPDGFGIDFITYVMQAQQLHPTVYLSG